MQIQLVAAGARVLFVSVIWNKLKRNAEGSRGIENASHKPNGSAGCSNRRFLRETVTEGTAQGEELPFDSLLPRGLSVSNLPQLRTVWPVVRSRPTGGQAETP